MMNHRARGYVMGVLGAVTYGLNPLFARPLALMGMEVPSVLFYRYLVAALILGALMLYKGHDFRLTWKELPVALVAGILFALSSLFLFQSYNLMDVGIASTILFVYPVFVTIMMVVMFGERVSVVTVAAIALAIVGIVMLGHGEGDGDGVNLWGVVVVLLSAISYAIYMVMVNKSCLRRLNTLKITFYSMVFGILVFVVQLDGLFSLQPVPLCAEAWIDVAGLAIFPTVVSLLTMTVAILDIGSIPTSILGALEPVTALAVGILAFGERLSPGAILGVALVIVSVVLIILSAPLMRLLRQFLISLPARKRHEPRR
ncbi:MAG: DMT family transporter [Bacteroidales bacterium]|nr:DMT family transporter [Bacteroidales bacterium]